MRMTGNSSCKVSNRFFSVSVLIPPSHHSGSDSAPHLLSTKIVGPEGKVPAGVYTGPYCTQLVLLALEEAVDRGVIRDDDITQEKLERFLSRSGRRFYKLPEPTKGTKIVLERKQETIPKSIKSADGSVEVGNSRAGAKVWSLRWERE
jgi:dihydroorotase